MSKGAFAGWSVAGLLLIALVSQCGKSSVSSAGAGGEAAALTSTRTLFVQPAVAKCRSRPSTGGDVVTRFSKATSVTVSREEAGWSLIDRSTSCWIRSDLLSIMPPLNAPEPIRPAYSAQGGGGGGGGGSGSPAHSPRRSQRYDAGSCPCRGDHVCIGPRGGRYCITSGGNKRYGV